MPEPSTEHLDALWRDYRRRLGLRVSSKGDSFLMGAIARIVGRRTNLSADNFLRDYVTTIRRRVFLPEGFEHWPIVTRLRLAVHEAQHVAQWREGRARFLVSYLTDRRARAEYEVEAMVAAHVFLAFVYGYQRPIDVFTEYVRGELVYAYDIPDDLAREAAQKADDLLMAIGEGRAELPTAALMAIELSNEWGES